MNNVGEIEILNISTFDASHIVPIFNAMRSVRDEKGFFIGSRITNFYIN